MCPLGDVGGGHVNIRMTQCHTDITEPKLNPKHANTLAVNPEDEALLRGRHLIFSMADCVSIRARMPRVTDTLLFRMDSSCCSVPKKPFSADLVAE